jgi:ribonuclease HII
MYWYLTVPGTATHKQETSNVALVLGRVDFSMSGKTVHIVFVILTICLVVQAYLGPKALSIQTERTVTGLFARKGNRRKSDDILSVEKGLVERGFNSIIGSDETGRGSVAGPVVAASCCVLADWSEYNAIAGVGDSKTLTPEERERIYAEVISKPGLYVWEVAQRTSKQIDDSNILMATMECFQESIEAVASKLPDDSVSYSIVDGKKSPKLSIKLPCRPWVKGDAEVYTVSLASILAKVTLDRLCSEWHQEYPEYGFDVNKGYATREHVEAIHRYGPCPLHRLSFKSLKGR